MKYIVIELQTNTDETVASLVTQHNTKNEAESKWHTVMAAAAISTLPMHSAVMMDASGFTYLQGSYEHPAE